MKHLTLNINKQILAIKLFIRNKPSKIKIYI
jgi:hypothetical protein